MSTSLTSCVCVLPTGGNGFQQGDSGLARSESSGSARPDPRAKPFVPPPSLAAKLTAKQGDGWTNDSGSVRSDASGTSGGGVGSQASQAPVLLPQGDCIMHVLQQACVLLDQLGVLVAAEPVCNVTFLAANSMQSKPLKHSQ